ncbi:MAG: L-serine ammonia-lyase, iron-sulfur-dependent subunit beta [Lachnospiraceae bacterium]
MVIEIMNVFDMIGPVMIGPSSSHTAGAARIGKVGYALLGEDVKEAHITLYGSFAKTYKGHGTDKALVAGVLGMKPDDKKLRNSLEIASQKGVYISFIESLEEKEHPNTVKLELNGVDGKAITLEAMSVGGGNIMVTSVNDMHVSFDCKHPTIVVLHSDVPGVIAEVAEELAKSKINIGNFVLSREKKGGLAVMTIEMDAAPDERNISNLARLPQVCGVTCIGALT